MGERVATGGGFAFADLWADAVFIFFSYDIKIIIDLYTPFLTRFIKLYVRKKPFFTKRTDL